MSYTTTEEKKFESEVKGANITAIVDQAVRGIDDDAKKEGFEHQVLSTFVVTVDYTGNSEGPYRAVAEALYAKIVPTIGHRGKKVLGTSLGGVEVPWDPSEPS